MKLYAENILLSDGWQKNKTIVIENGIIIDIMNGKDASALVAKGPVIPGMINCHSHAFQRAFAGFSEQGSEGQDSFWTWRKIMYKFLAQLTQTDAQLIAQQLYIEMLKSGYTRVAEFHYLHHDIDGVNYSEAPNMANAIFDAAKNAGIGLTMLPVLYQYSGSGEQAPSEGQKRFIHSIKKFNDLVSECFSLSQDYQNTNVGIAPHSLRAVDKESLHAAIKHIRELDQHAPIHIHIAEQQKEVEDCIAHYGKRPVQWLLDNCSIDEHWCLIHATHIDEQERRGIIDAKGVAGICPTTEANLGDGIFPTTEFMAEGGVIAIGSDSHISVNPVEELRWLEYAQRLVKQQRAILAAQQQPSVGLHLWQQANYGGAQSTTEKCGELAVGKQADLLVLDPQKTKLFASSLDTLMDSFVFASQTNVIQDVMVHGSWVIKNREHELEKDTQHEFSELLTKLSR